MVEIKKNIQLVLLSFIGLTLLYSCSNNSPAPVPNTDDNNSNIIRCENGFADGFPCNGYDLVAEVPLSTLDAIAANDSWGWTDSSTGKEYALVCLNNGVAFIDISNPEIPLYLGKLPTATISSPWRDVKVYNDHAFIVADNVQGEDSHGMQVFDLAKLRTVTNPPTTFSADTRLEAIGRAHNIVINESSGYAYAVGGNIASTYNGGPIFVNIQNPKTPIIEGGFGAGNYSHDAQVVTYNGPDSDYTGREILVGSNENEVVIADVTNKSNPVTISTISYTNVGYTHQGWFTEDMRYFIVGDELDEIRHGNSTRLVIFDFNDLDAPVHHFDYLANNTSVDHNGYVKGNTYYQASYRAGLRVIDINSIASRSFTETGFFDTYPSDDATLTDGAWNVYPFFESGNIIISDINRGLLIVRPSE